MKLYKVKKFNQLLTPKEEFNGVRTYYNLDKNLNFIPRLHEAGHQKTNVDGSLSWETSVIRNENVEELTEIPKHLMRDLGNYELDMNLLAEEESGTYIFDEPSFIIYTQNYSIVIDVFYNRDVRKIAATRLQPEEEETLSVEIDVDLKAIHIRDVEFLPFSKKQKQIIEKRLEDNVYYG